MILERPDWINNILDEYVFWVWRNYDIFELCEEDWVDLFDLPWYVWEEWDRWHLANDWYYDELIYYLNSHWLEYGQPWWNYIWNTTAPAVKWKYDNLYTKFID